MTMNEQTTKEIYDLTENLNNPDFKLQKPDSDKPDSMKLSSRQKAKKKKKKSSYLKSTYSLCSFPDLKKIKIANRNEMIEEKVQNQ